MLDLIYRLTVRKTVRLTVRKTVRLTVRKILLTYEDSIINLFCEKK